MLIVLDTDPLTSEMSRLRTLNIRPLFLLVEHFGQPTVTADVINST